MLTRRWSVEYPAIVQLPCSCGLLLGVPQPLVVSDQAHPCGWSVREQEELHNQLMACPPELMGCRTPKFVAHLAIEILLRSIPRLLPLLHQQAQCLPEMLVLVALLS